MPAGARDKTTIPRLDEAAMEAARLRWAGRAKPPGALGALEGLAVQLAGVTGNCPPPVIERPHVALFAGDHGVVLDGASAWPQEVTAAMVATIASGGAAINALARTVGAEVTVVDVGVATDLGGLLAEGSAVVDRRVRSGTASIVSEPAMTRAEAAEAIEVGVAQASALIEAGADCLIGGEMGIGNTTPSVALIAACTGADPAELTGPGAGEPAGGLAHKRSLIEAALERASLPGPSDDLDGTELVAELGGLEIAALAGFWTEAAARRVPFVVDGVISLASLCVADQLAPGTAARAVAGHRSTEPAASISLDHLGLHPLLDLDLRLGEGTGATLAVPLLQASARALADMADLPGA